MAGVALLAAENFGAIGDLRDVLGDLVLPRSVGFQRQILDHVGRVVGGGLHRPLPVRRLRGGPLPHRAGVDVFARANGDRPHGVGHRGAGVRQVLRPGTDREQRPIAGSPMSDSASMLRPATTRPSSAVKTVRVHMAHSSTCISQALLACLDLDQ